MVREASSAEVQVPAAEARETSARPLRVAFVAGERSGDALGAGLIRELKSRHPDAQFVGIAGDGMIEAGCDPWYHADELSVMGLAEVLRHLPRLLRIRRNLVARLTADPPDVFIGIDSPDFNVPVESALRAAGIATVQYVSPQIWAWRQSRVSTMRTAADVVLCVLPFEADFYAEHGVNARFVGHPLADAIPPAVDRAAAREALGIRGDTPLVALLPGSRRAEVSRLARPFLGAAAWLQHERPGTRCAVALASPAMGTAFVKAVGDLRIDPPPFYFTARTREVMAAADAVLTASGTASLEAMLLKRPMVVAYRVAPLTYRIARRLGVGRVPHFSLPNLLSGRRIVPEFLQDQVRPAVLGPALLECLDGRLPDPDWYRAFDGVHRQLRRGADTAAAEAVLELLGTRGRRLEQPHFTERPLDA